MHFFIVTGGSKGLGESLVRLASQKGHAGISISRSGGKAASNFTSITHDLKDLSGLSEKLSQALMAVDFIQVEAIHLVNNAAVLLPVGSLADQPESEIKDHLETNLITPVLLSSWFLKQFGKMDLWKTITNISSGAAVHPIQGWALYCTSKAGLKMFTENLQLEQKNPQIKFLNFTPGVVDTGMQATIRAQPKEKFSRVDEFKKLKSENQLRSPDSVAEGLLQILLEPQKINKVNYDIKEMD